MPQERIFALGITISQLWLYREQNTYNFNLEDSMFSIVCEYFIYVRVNLMIKVTADLIYIILLYM